MEATTRINNFPHLKLIKSATTERQFLWLPLRSQLLQVWVGLTSLSGMRWREGYIYTVPAPLPDKGFQQVAVSLDINVHIPSFLLSAAAFSKLPLVITLSVLPGQAGRVVFWIRAAVASPSFVGNAAGDAQVASTSPHQLCLAPAPEYWALKEPCSR